SGSERGRVTCSGQEAVGGVGRSDGGYGVTVDETRSGKPDCNKVPRARGCELDLICELPYRPAACRTLHQRPDTCQHPTTRNIPSKRFFLHPLGRPYMLQRFEYRFCGKESF